MMPKLFVSVMHQIRKGQMPSMQPHHSLVYNLPAEVIVQLAQAHAHSVEKQAAALDYTRKVQHSQWCAEQERLRVGYISSDFGNHPLSQLMQSVFGLHNQDRYEIFGFALSPHDGTPARQKIEAGIEHFYDVHSLSTVELCELVENCRLHILVDLN
eukprot:RCo048519